jgi:hypothetical protein
LPYTYIHEECDEEREVRKSLVRRCHLAIPTKADAYQSVPPHMRTARRVRWRRSPERVSLPLPHSTDSLVSFALALMLGLGQTNNWKQLGKG